MIVWPAEMMSSFQVFHKLELYKVPFINMLFAWWLLVNEETALPFTGEREGEGERKGGRERERERVSQVSWSFFVWVDFRRN